MACLFSVCYPCYRERIFLVHRPRGVSLLLVFASASAAALVSLNDSDDRSFRSMVYARQILNDAYLAGPRLVNLSPLRHPLSAPPFKSAFVPGATALTFDSPGCFGIVARCCYQTGAVPQCGPSRRHRHPQRQSIDLAQGTPGRRPDRGDLEGRGLVGGRCCSGIGRIGWMRRCGMGGSIVRRKSQYSWTLVL